MQEKAEPRKHKVLVVGSEPGFIEDVPEVLVLGHIDPLGAVFKLPLYSGYQVLFSPSRSP